MIPLKDNLPTSRFPVVTVVLIAINVAVFIWQLSFSTSEKLDAVGYGSVDQSSLEYGATPYRITNPGEDPQCAIGAVGAPDPSTGESPPGVVCQGLPEYERAEERSREGQAPEPIPLDQAPWWVTLFTSMFMHGGFLHIAFNMLFLWVFGNNIEDSMGRGRFVAFYLLGGLVAAYSQAAVDPDFTGPMIGASGAVAAVLGGYALLHPKARVLTLLIIIFFITVVEIPAAIMLAIWFVLQFIGPISDAALGVEGNVAYFAHVGGFLFGLAAIKLFARRSRDQDPALPA